MATETWAELAGYAIFPMGGAPGVYVIYDHRGNPKYVGSSDRVWGRLGDKHVSGDNSHAIQRAYLLAIPDKEKRVSFIQKHIKVHIVETSSLAEAVDLENRLIAKYRPSWNIKGIAGKRKTDAGVSEPFDPEFMQPYI